MLEELPSVVMTANGPTIDGWSPGILRNLLDTYEQELDSGGFTPRRHLGGGLPEKDIRTQLAAIGMQPPQELITWFSWADGCDVQLPGIFPARLADAIEKHLRADAELYEHSDPRLEGITWGVGPGWLRLELDNYSKAINCNPGLADPPEIRAMDPEFDPNVLRLRCVSLATLVTWWIEGLRVGAYRWAPSTNAWLIDDFAAVPALQKTAGFA